MTEATLDSAPSETAAPAMVTSMGLWADAFRRLKKDKLALTCLIIIVFYSTMAFLAWIGIIAANYAAPSADSYAPPSLQHWLGTDIFGRGIL